MVNYIPQVGDLVTIVKDEKDWNLQGRMDKYVGTTQKIEKVHEDHKGLYFKFTGDNTEDDINWWYWRTHHLTPYIGKKKVIKLKFK